MLNEPKVLPPLKDQAKPVVTTAKWPGQTKTEKANTLVFGEQQYGNYWTKIRRERKYRLVLSEKPTGAKSTERDLFGWEWRCDDVAAHHQIHFTVDVVISLLEQTVNNVWIMSQTNRHTARQLMTPSHYYANSHWHRGQ